MKKIIVLFMSCGFLLAGCSSPGKTASRAGIKFGTAVQPADILDETKREILIENFNTLVPENNMKMVNIRPTKKLWNFSDMDSIVDFAVKNKMNVRGHTFVWHQQNGTYVSSLKTKEEAFALIKENITEIMTRYKGKIYEYDVCNEIFEEDGSFRNSIWYKLCGTELYEFAFKTAREVDPDARLVLNDFNNEAMGNPKADAFYGYVKALVEKGIPVDGVGMQLHLSTEYGMDADAIRKNIERFHALGVEVVFTEIDIRMKMPETEESVSLQKDMYLDLMKLLSESENVGTYMTWGVSDASSWVPRAFPGCGNAHLFDRNLKAKPVLGNLSDMMKKIRK